MPFTSDPDEIYDRIAHTKPFGRTSLLDAIHMGLATMKHAQNLRKALVIVSDGGDNRSRHTEREIKNAMLESDCRFTPWASSIRTMRRNTPPKSRMDPASEELADETGGQEYPVTSLDDLPSISARIGNQLRNQYLFGYSPLNAGARWKIPELFSVKVNPQAEIPDLRVYYRHGYYSPGM